MIHKHFYDRVEAGLLLAEKLKAYSGKNAVILAIPKGGVPIGYQLSLVLKLPLDLALSKKIGHPYNKEFAIGSVSPDTVIMGETGGVSQDYIDMEIIRIRQELQKQYRLFMGQKSPVSVKDKIVILADDGIATGNTVLATIAMLRKNKVSKIVVATPVIPQSTASRISLDCDELVYISAPFHFPGVGAFYENFEQVTDEEVIQLLKEANKISHEQH